MTAKRIVSDNLMSISSFRTGVEYFRLGSWALACSEFKLASNALRTGPSRQDISVAQFVGAMERSAEYYTGGLEDDLVKATNLALNDSAKESSIVQRSSKLARDMHSLFCRVDALPAVGASKSQIEDAHSHSVAILSESKAIESYMTESTPEDEAVARVFKQYFVAVSLLLRGRILAASGDAVLSEGLFKASMDQSRIGAKISQLHRFSEVTFSAQACLGDLLKRWEGRESEADKVLSTVPKESELLLSNRLTTEAQGVLLIPSYSLAISSLESSMP